MTSVWDEVERKLVELYSLPHNRGALGPRVTPQARAKTELGKVKDGLAFVEAKDFWGPMLFLRVVGPGNNPYGQWWFNASVFDTLETSYFRIYFDSAEKKRVVRDILREALAVSTEWNSISEVSALEIPPGQAIRGYSGPGNPQKLFANLHLTDRRNRLLAGRVNQVFFPVKNPFGLNNTST
jgi:hypothetical protein